MYQSFYNKKIQGGFIYLVFGLLLKLQDTCESLLGNSVSFSCFDFLFNNWIGVSFFH